MASGILGLPNRPPKRYTLPNVQGQLSTVDTLPKEPRSMDGMPSNLSIAEAAAQLGVSEKTVRRWIAAGRLSAHKVSGPYGEQWRVDAAAVQGAGQALAVVATEQPTDPRTLALVIVQALTEQQAPLREAFAQQGQQLTELRDEVRALRQGLAAALDALKPQQAAAVPVDTVSNPEPPIPPVVETAPEPLDIAPAPVQARSWWRFW